MLAVPLVPSSSSAFASAAVSFVKNINKEIIFASVNAVSKLIVCVSLGFLARKRKKMDQAAITSLSTLTYNIFQPALLLVNVAQTLATAEGGLMALLPLPAFAIGQIMLGSILASLLCKLQRLPKDSQDHRVVKMCSTFANSGPLPLLFADALFKNFADPTLTSRAVAYISFYLLGWSPMFWTYGYGIAAGGKTTEPVVLDTSGMTAIQAFKAKIKIWWNDPNTRRIFSPPVFGCIFGAFIGLTNFLPQSWAAFLELFIGLTPLKSLLVGKQAPLSPIFDALRTLGGAYLPAAILVLAGSLAGKQTDGVESSGFVRNVSTVMVARFILMPLAALGLVNLGIATSLLPKDNMLYFILLMQACMPSAQNSVIMLQMEGEVEAANSMAKTLSTVYILSIIPMALLLTAALQYAKL
eukprot:CAMPEP_0117750188 /NCGR_PEP_ID=MMETSP0947-20121206/10204_1 /TAXON_ID=44440 /ORGANISM="Chattonella subsalsa, Strain CCMP2191" /LENGTH=411 /DNA_ID=CAMNT_0005568277 /DNA_START=221 /DNA_END=1455 /DNA_ORIENTATION=+